MNETNMTVLRFRNTSDNARAIDVYDITNDLYIPTGLRHLACSLVPRGARNVRDLFLLAGGELSFDVHSNKAYFMDPNVMGGNLTVLPDLPMTISQLGSQDTFAVFRNGLSFLLVGSTKNGALSTRIHWNPLISNFTTRLSLGQGR
ncbi:hypothetical protein TCAL_15148, partial [Tigriopus californicus]